MNHLKFKKYILSLFFILAASFSVSANDDFPQEDIHLEGVYTEIKPSDIGEDIFLWAQDTAKDLEDVLKTLPSKPAPQQRKEILTVLHNATAQISGQRELLLMHYLINRAIALDAFFSNDSRAVNYVLLPSLKKAIHFYKNTDLPFLEKNAGKPNATEILPPDYTVLVQEMLPMLLTASEMNGSTENRFEILRLSLVWTILDFHNSLQNRRNPHNAKIIKRLYTYYRDEIKDFPSENADFILNNEIRKKLSESILAPKNEIEELTPLEQKNWDPNYVHQPFPEEAKIIINKYLSFLNGLRVFPGATAYVVKYFSLSDSYLLQTECTFNGESRRFRTTSKDLILSTRPALDRPLNYTIRTNEKWLKYSFRVRYIGCDTGYMTYGEEGTFISSYVGAGTQNLIKFGHGKSKVALSARDIESAE